MSVTGGAAGRQRLGEAGGAVLDEPGQHRARAVDVAVHRDARGPQHLAGRAVGVDRLHDERLVLGRDRGGHLPGRGQLGPVSAGLLGRVAAEVAGQQHAVDLVGGEQHRDAPGVARGVLLARAGEVDRVGHRGLRPQRRLELGGERAGQHRGHEPDRHQRVGGHGAVAATVGEDRDPAAGHPPRRAQGDEQVGQLGRVVDAVRPDGRARRVDDHRGAGERAGVGGRAAHRRLGATGGQQDQRLARVPQRPGSVEEGAAVDDVLGVDGDGARPVVVDAGVQEVDEPQVRLVAERDEAGDPQPAVGQQAGEVEDEVAALAEHRHVAGGQHGVRELEPGRGVDDAEAVGADAAPRRRRARPPAPRPRAGRPRRPVSESPAVIPTIARAPAATASVTAATKPGGRHADHGQVDAAVVGARPPPRADG